MNETRPEASPAALLDDRSDGRWLLYGSYGYTGRLIARAAVERGERPILAGRDRDRLRAQAEPLGLEYRAFDLSDTPELQAALGEVEAVLHAAGPFVNTFRPMVEACLRTGTHYLDITGEIDVLETLAVMGARAESAGIVLLPAVGFDVVPTDCAAVAAVEAAGEVVRLEIAFHSTGGSSRGTALSGIRGLKNAPRERVAGRLQPFRHGSIRRSVPFTDRPREAVAIPWGDVATAYRSTGAPNIRVYATARPRTIRLIRAIGALRPVLAAWPFSAMARWWVDRRVTGPDDEALRTGRTRVWARAESAGGGAAEVELVTPDAYALTADAAVTAVTTLLDESYDGPASGFLTPSMAFGAGFVSRLGGVEWTRGGPGGVT